MKKKLLALSLALVLCLGLLPVTALADDTAPTRGALGNNTTVWSVWDITDGVLTIKKPDAQYDASQYPVVPGSTLDNRTDVKVLVLLDGANLSLRTFPNLEAIFIEQNDTTDVLNCSNLAYYVENFSMNNTRGVSSKDFLHNNPDNFGAPSANGVLPGARKDHKGDPIVKCYHLTPYGNSELLSDMKAAIPVLKKYLPADHEAWARIPYALGGTAPNPSYEKYHDDVTTRHTVSDWAKDGVQEAYDFRMWSYTMNNLTDLTAPVTRGQFSVILCNALRLAGSEASAGDDIGEWDVASYKDTHAAIRSEHFRDGDIADDDVTALRVNRLHKWGIIDGYGDGNETVKPTFGYDDPITREQAATILVRSLSLQAKWKDQTEAGWTDVYATAPVFPDVTVDTTPVAYADAVSDWAKDGVYAVSNLGIMSGYGNGVFGAKDGLTVEQAIVMCFRLAQRAKLGGGLIEDSKAYDATYGADPYAGPQNAYIDGETLRKQNEAEYAAFQEAMEQLYEAQMERDLSKPKQNNATAKPAVTPKVQHNDTWLGDNLNIPYNPNIRGGYTKTADDRNVYYQSNYDDSYTVCLTTYYIVEKDGTVTVAETDGFKSIKNKNPDSIVDRYLGKYGHITALSSSDKAVYFDSCCPNSYAITTEKMTEVHKTNGKPNPVLTPTGAATQTASKPAVTAPAATPKPAETTQPTVRYGETFVDSKGFTWVQMLGVNDNDYCVFINGEPVTTCGNNWDELAGTPKGAVDLGHRISDTYWGLDGYDPADQTEADKAPRTASY